MRRHLACITLLWVASATTVASAQPLPDPPEFYGAWIDAGDPRAVPIILDRLRDAASRPLSSDLNLSQLVDCIRDASFYRLEAAGPLMALVYEDHTEHGRNLSMLCYAASQYRSPAAMKFQRRLLDDPRVVDHNQRVPLMSALAEQGDNAAADALADFVEGELQRFPIEGGHRLSAEVWLTRSTHFADRIAAIPEPEHAKSKQLLQTVRLFLPIAQKDVPELIRIVSTATPAQTQTTRCALTILGRTANLSDLPTIQQMPLGLDNAFVENDGMTAARDDAIALIRRRHWSELTAADHAGQRRR